MSVYSYVAKIVSSSSS